MTRKSILTITIYLISGLLLFYYVQSGLRPARTKEQKIFDDYVANLQITYQQALHDTDIPDSENSDYPSFRLEFNPGSSSNYSENLAFSLNWKDLEKTRKGLRMLELLSISNIFSNQKHIGNKKFNQITVTSSGGYEFKTAFDDNDIRSNHSLSLVLVLLKS